MRMCVVHKIKFPQPKSRSQVKAIGLTLTYRVSAITEKLMKGILSNLKER